MKIMPTPTPKETAKSFNILLFVSAFLMALGIMLPCYTISYGGYSQSIYYLGNSGEFYGGVFFLLSTVAVALLAMFKKDKFAVIPGVVSVILLIKLCLAFSDIVEFGAASAAIGTYVMWIGSVAACVVPFIKRKLHF